MMKLRSVMSDEAVEQKIAQLEQDKRVAEELLFLVLDRIDEPVVLDVSESKKLSTKDRFIDIDIDVENDTWTLQVVTFHGQP